MNKSVLEAMPFLHLIKMLHTTTCIIWGFLFSKIKFHNSAFPPQKDSRQWRNKMKNWSWNFPRFLTTVIQTRRSYPASPPNYPDPASRAEYPWNGIKDSKIGSWISFSFHFKPQEIRSFHQGRPLERSCLLLTLRKNAHGINSFPGCNAPLRSEVYVASIVKWKNSKVGQIA